MKQKKYYELLFITLVGFERLGLETKKRRL